MKPARQIKEGILHGIAVRSVVDLEDYLQFTDEGSFAQGFRVKVHTFPKKSMINATGTARMGESIVHSAQVVNSFKMQPMPIPLHFPSTDIQCAAIWKLRKFISGRVAVVESQPSRTTQILTH
jgi:hypothetical protein